MLGSVGAEAHPDSLRTYDLYPMSELRQLTQAGRDVCVLHVIRHAEGTHNVNKQYRDPANLVSLLATRPLFHSILICVFAPTTLLLRACALKRHDANQTRTRG